MNSIITAFAKGIERLGIEPSRVCVPSDIPFEPEVINYLGLTFSILLEEGALPSEQG